MEPGDDRVLVTLSLSLSLGEAPSVEDVARSLGLSPSHFDEAFGIVPIAPARGLFAARVDPDHGNTTNIGPQMSDPEIAPFE